MADIVKGLRDAIQDLLVPELKAVQVELKHLNEAQQETNKRLDTMDKRFEALHAEMLDLKLGQREILAKLDLDKRVSRIEVLLEELRKQKVAN